jgi:hypothetical protein
MMPKKEIIKSEMGDNLAFNQRVVSSLVKTLMELQMLLMMKKLKTLDHKDRFQGRAEIQEWLEEKGSKEKMKKMTKTTMKIRRAKMKQTITNLKGYALLKII